MFLLAPLISIASNFLARQGARLLLAGMVAALLVAGVLGVRALRLERDRAQVQAETAAAELRRVRDDLDLERRNASEAADALDQAYHERAFAWLQVERLKERLAHAQQAVPKGCENVLDPLRDAVRGLHDIRAARAAGSSPAPGSPAAVHR